MKQVFGLLFCVILSAVSFAEPLRICPACGREDLKGVAACPYCKAPLPPLPPVGRPAEAVAPTPPDVKGASLPTGAFEAASKDVAEARARSADEAEVAFALYENALALLFADSGADFNTRAAGQIEEELEQCRDRLQRAARGSFPVHRKLMLDGRNGAARFFKTQGRIPFGRVWVPSDWPSRLSPPRLAAIRHGLQPVCKACDGLGAVPCRQCKGQGRLPCDYPGCKNGWVESTPANTLGGTDRRASAALKTRTRCPLCGGSSLKPCPDCQASGRAVCRKCGGNGEAPVCTTCQGDGLVICKKCARAIEKGERAAPLPGCIECRGSGKKLCPTCGGDGRIRR